MCIHRRGSVVTCTDSTGRISSPITWISVVGTSSKRSRQYTPSVSVEGTALRVSTKAARERLLVEEEASSLSKRLRIRFVAVDAMCVAHEGF